MKRSLPPDDEKVNPWKFLLFLLFVLIVIIGVGLFFWKVWIRNS